MKKILCTAIAIAFMSVPAYAAPVKMTTAQLDEVTAAGKRKVVVVKNKVVTKVNQEFTADDISIKLIKSDNNIVVIGNTSVVVTKVATTTD
jgi:hypothetical protein